MSTNFPSPSGKSIPQGRSEEVSASDSPAASLLSQPKKGHDLGFAIWVHRISVLLFVSLSAIFGVLLVILPWTPKWTDNYILISYPAVRDFMENGFVRGMCTGLGVIDVWIGFSEATHYQEKHHQA